MRSHLIGSHRDQLDHRNPILVDDWQTGNYPLVPTNRLAQKPPSPWVCKCLSRHGPKVPSLAAQKQVILGLCNIPLVLEEVGRDTLSSRDRWSVLR